MIELSHPLLTALHHSRHFHTITAAEEEKENAGKKISF